jgi:hypothetical protein
MDVKSIELTHDHFQTNSSVRKMEAVCFSETLVTYLCIRLQGAVRNPNPQKVPSL